MFNDTKKNLTPENSEIKKVSLKSNDEPFEPHDIVFYKCDSQYKLSLLFLNEDEMIKYANNNLFRKYSQFFW